jgi:glyceraldehyde 3-phosphate dehydrogenase
MVLFKKSIAGQNVSDIINLHQYAGEFVGKPKLFFDPLKLQELF